MPGETGLDLLQHLAEHPEQRGTARLAVFSAGLNAAMQARLASFDVWRQLGKPIALTELEQCVRDAIGAAAPPPAATVAAAELDGLSAAEQATVERHFAGDRALFLAYRASCVAQFANDLRQGDDAFARADAPALKPGDFIELDLEKIIQAKVDGVPVFDCYYGTSNGKYALRVNKLVSSSTAGWIGEQNG